MKVIFSSHLSYNLNDPNGGIINIVSNGDIIWKNNYWDWATLNNITQVWVKSTMKKTPLWKNRMILLQVKKMKDIHLLWKTDKALLKENLRSEVFSLVKSVGKNNGNRKIDNIYTTLWDSSLQDDGVILKNNSILYFWEEGSEYMVNLEDDRAFNGNKNNYCYLRKFIYYKRCHC